MELLKNIFTTLDQLHTWGVIVFFVIIVTGIGIIKLAKHGKV